MGWLDEFGKIDSKNTEVKPGEDGTTSRTQKKIQNTLGGGQYNATNNYEGNSGWTMGLTRPSKNGKPSK